MLSRNAWSTYASAVGAPGSARPGSLDRLLDDHADALFDFALAVTDGPDAALATVREAIPAAVEAYGPSVARPALLGHVLEAALRRTGRVAPRTADLLETGAATDLDDLRRVCRRATLALEVRDRAALDLTLRQGLEGEELAQALGVAPGLASATTQAAVEQAEHVVGAVLLSRVARDDCPGLAAVVDGLGPDAGLDRLAAAVVEHQGECPSCSDRRRALVPVASLLAAVSPAAAPAALRHPAPDPAPAAAPPPPRSPAPARRPLLRAVAALLAGLVLAVVAAAVLRRDGDESARAPAAGGGRLVVPQTELDLGRTGVDVSFEIVNGGTEPLRFRARSGDPWLTLMAGEGTIEPAETLHAVAVLDRSRAPEGDVTTEIRVSSTGGSAFVPVRAEVNRAPELTGLATTPEWVVHDGCPGATPAQVRVSVVEESGTATVVLHWRGPDRTEGTAAMAGDPQSSFVASIGPFPSAGDVTWWVSATDARANTTVSPSQVLRVDGC